LRQTFSGSDDAAQALVDLRTFLSSPGGGSYVAQAGTAYGSHCARSRHHTSMEVASIHSGHDGRGQAVYIPIARCKVCKVRWPQVQANVPRWEVSGGQRSDAREEAMFLKARLEAAWEAMVEATDELAGRVYEHWALRTVGGYDGLADLLSMLRVGGRECWTAEAVRWQVSRARRAFRSALAERRLLRRAA